MTRSRPGMLVPAALLAAVLVLSACASHPVLNISGNPVSSSKANPSTDEVRAAIVRAGAALGWQMKPDRPGHIIGRLLLREHSALVDIDYDAKSYSIKYKESSNLQYDNGNIHRSYNGWIRQLDKGIQTQLANLY